MNKLVDLNQLEGRRFRKEGNGAFGADPNGDYVATWKLSGNMEYVPAEGLVVLERYTAECEAAKQEYLDKLVGIKAKLDSDLAEINTRLTAK